MKIDGYIRKDWQVELRELGKAQIVQEIRGMHVAPVCLVPPELLEWVEKVRGYLALIGSVWANEFLTELEKILPEKGEK